MDAEKAAALERNFKTELESLKQIQRDIQKNHQARQQFTQQKNENEMVLKELDLGSDEGSVYKLIGPALIKQDPVEARSNVGKRLEFINGELDRLDSRLKALEKQAAERQQKVVSIQQEVQRLSQAAASAVAE
ncbi:probable prefoldin subunit 6 [Coccomyxa sp. Obi]|nr:probable prefoldin subunit 6 [Coccomyxa sp. Obi]